MPKGENTGAAVMGCGLLKAQAVSNNPLNVQRHYEYAWIAAQGDTFTCNWHLGRAHTALNTAMLVVVSAGPHQ